MLTPKSLTLSGIGRFVEEQTIDFTKLGSLVEICGQNNNTGGSSGSAKTTLLRAIEFNLGINDIPVSILQSRLTDNTIYTKGVYELDGIPLIIERGKKLSITYNGETTTGSSKITEEKLDQLLGMPRDLFRKILHKRQGEGGFFLNMGPSEVHKFLTSCLGLTEEQSKLTKLDSILEELNKSHNVAFNGVLALQSAIEAFNEAMVALGPSPEEFMSASDLLELENAHALAYKQHKEEAFKLHEALKSLELERPIVSITPFDRSKIEQVEIDISRAENAEHERQLKVQGDIAEIKFKINELEKAELARQNEVKAKIAHTEQEISKLADKEFKRQNDVKNQITVIDFKKIELANTLSEGERAKVEAVKLSEELKNIRAAICPTCEQGWVNDAAKAKEESLVKKLQEYKKAVFAGMEAEKAILVVEEERKVLVLESDHKTDPQLTELKKELDQLLVDSRPRKIEEIPQLNKQINRLLIDSSIDSEKVAELKAQLLLLREEEREHQFKENARSQLIVVEFASKQTKLREKHEVLINLAQANERKALSELESAKNRAISFQEAKKRFDEAYGNLRNQEHSYQNDLVKKEFELSKVKENVELATEAKKAIKSYLSCSFDDALDSISDMATRLVRSIPNMATATIQFEGLKETKEGKIKEEVVCLVSMDGETAVPLKSLSGGERSSCDMAIDLSVIRFIEERTGKGIDLYIIDEGFNGLDTNCIQDALEMLKEYSVDKRLFLVEHNPIVSESIESRLLVVRDGITSKIVQQ